MSWRQMAPHIINAVKMTASGATITLGSTVVSCALALQIEAASHRTLFKFFPHWYANVEHAYGIPDEMLATVRMEARNSEEDRLRLALFEQQEEEQALQASADNKIEQPQEIESDNRTIFNIESLVLGPARKQLQELSEISFTNELSASAMTA